MRNARQPSPAWLLKWVCQTVVGDTDAWQRLSIIHGQMSTFHGVMGMLPTYTGLDPNNAKAHSHLDNVHIAAGRPMQAIAACLRKGPAIRSVKP